MPSGMTHERVQIAATPILTVSATALVITQGVEWPRAAYIIAGAFLGGALSIIFTPDLIDIDADPLPEKRIRSIWGVGWVVAGVYDFISRRIPHRGVSHNPIGTLISIFWLIPFIVLWPEPVAWIIAWKIVADLFHTILDPISTRIKRFRG